MSSEQSASVETACEIASASNSNDVKMEKSLENLSQLVSKLREDLNKIKKVIEKEFYFMKHGDSLQFVTPAESDINKYKRKLEPQKRFHSTKRKPFANLNLISSPTAEERDKIKSKLLK